MRSRAEGLLSLELCRRPWGLRHATHREYEFRIPGRSASEAGAPHSADGADTADVIYNIGIRAATV